MNVFLTVDVETYTGDYDAEVWGMGKGLDWLLETCGRHGVRATFFVEALGATRWGMEGLKKVCGRIQEDGHEVQLHLHPVVARIDGFQDSADLLWKHDAATQERLLRRGIDILREAGVGQVKAFRAGDLAAGENTLAAMEKAGLLLGSNRDSDTKSVRSKVNDLFPVSNDIARRGRMIDLPVSAFRSPLPALDGRYRHLQVCAVGAQEMRNALLRMDKAGYACATILTHPGEFFRKAGGETFPARKNRRRFEALLQFLASRDDMKARAVSQCLDLEKFPEKSPTDVRPPLLWTLVRVCEQAIERARRKRP